MTKVKRPHIVPEFYLNYFSDSRGKIYVFDKPKFHEFESKPNKVAKLNGYYDLDYFSDYKQKQIIETKLSQIESEVAPIYKSLIERIEAKEFNGFFEKEKLCLSKFIYTQMIRTVGGRNKIEQIHNEIDRQLSEKLTKENYKKATHHLCENNPKLQQLFMLASNLEEISSELYSRIWVIHANKTKHLFLTSDHPVGTHNHGNITKTEHEIFIPLTPKYLLSLLIPDQLPNFKVWNNKVLDLDDRECSKWYNCATVLGAERQIFSNEPHFVFARKVLEANPKYKCLKQQRVGRPDYH